MKKDNSLLMGLVFGLFIGVILFALKLAGVYSGSSVPICLGLLTLVLDGICFIPVFNNHKNKKLMSSGTRTEAYISKIEHEIINPKYYVKDASGRRVPPEYDPNIPVTYSLELKYSAGGTEQSMQLVTPPVTAADIAPYGIYEGAHIPIKYMDNHPSWTIIDIPYISKRTVEDQKTLLYKGPFTALIITTIYIVYLILKVF